MIGIFSVSMIKSYLFKYINLEVIIVLSNMSYDLNLLYLVIIFRPQRLPEHFTLYFDGLDSETKTLNIYLAKFIGSKENIDKTIFTDNSIPLVIIHPYQVYDKTKMMNKIQIGIRNN